VKNSSATLTARIRRDLKLPVIIAPMFLVSGPELVVAAARAGLMGSFPTQNARTVGELRKWFDRIRTELAEVREQGDRPGAWAVSLIVHPSYDRFAQELELLTEYRPEFVVTALGSPSRVLGAVHSYGGAVFADVMSLTHARKAVDAGADGLVLVCSGAGGHTGSYSPFAFVSEVRRFFDGPLVVGGAISDGRGIRAAEVLGADLVYMGTRFIACPESMVNDEYRSMLVRAGMDGIVTTKAVTGVLCNWLKESIAAAGFDETQLAAQGKVDFSNVHGEHKPWKNIYGAGQGAGSVDRVASVAEVVEQLLTEYRAIGIGNGPRSSVLTEEATKNVGTSHYL
jgi:nitronate monooxygenase